MSTRKPPRWTVAFLRALERSGEVEAAARDAGIDKSTAYARRKAHPGFADEWDEALRLRSGRAEAEVQERVGFWERVKNGLSPTPPPCGKPSSLGDELFSASPAASPTAAGSHRLGDGALPGAPASGRGELLATTSLGGKMVRAGPGRWNQTREARFFDELAATANVSRAAEAAGVSKNAVYARRMKQPDFRAKWDAVLETGRAAIEMHLVETAKKSFDPDDLDVEGVEPKVSVAEAIKIVQLHGNKAEKHSIEDVEPPEDEVAAIRERLVHKLQRLRDRMMPERIAEGWSYGEAFDHMVPPGWVRSETSADSS